MPYILTGLLLVAGFSAPAFGLGCPQSSSELMSHFGRSLRRADMLALTPSAANAETLAAAVAGIESAIECGRLTIEDCGMQLLPPRLQENPHGYRAFMTEFLARLADYRALFIDQQALPEEQRDFSLIAQMRLIIQEIVNRAHAAF
ncbi:MAG: hypothetical protein KF799_16385 [Bdellovibrionales bacterium]|nr:hypothetical protein [Bdellovibrionales bacterium]